MEQRGRLGRDEVWVVEGGGWGGEGVGYVG